MRRSIAVLCLVPVAMAAGCTTTGEATPYEAALRQARTCDDVLAAIQEDAIAKVDLELQSYVDQDDEYPWGGPVIFDDGRDLGSSGGAGGVPTAAPEGDAGDGAEPPAGFSDTNRQVAEVDEADIVKVGDEGRKLYVIRGNGFHEFKSWPAADTSWVADLEIEGAALEMFVEGRRAVVFSSVYGVEPLDDGDLCQGYYGAPEPGFADVDYYYPCGRSFVKITVIDLSEDAPKTVRELYVDGWYTSSRRHDGIVRTVIQSNMQRPNVVPNMRDFIWNGQVYPETREDQITLALIWAAQAKEAIRATTLEQWVPVWGERIDGEITEQPVQCADFYSPTAGLTNYGLTQIVGIDIDDDSSPAITSILGQASQVYANVDTLVLTQPDWSWFERDRDSDRTAVHRFEVPRTGKRTPYQGSGFVPGIVNDQFSIDERAGIIRIATTRTTWNQSRGDEITPGEWIPPTTHNFISTMGLQGDALEILGSTPPLAEGETIFSARFLGDLGYIVTFRRIDPLFAIDLKDPAAPTVLGELKIPGFSDYMHPLGEKHLLTIGRDIDEETQIDNGTALQIFDVTDPAAPMLAHKQLLGQGFSEANHNHKAFNYYADKGLLAFPYVSYVSEFSSTLELWEVSATEGFKRRGEAGAIHHSDLVLDDCGGEPYPIEDFYDHCHYQPQITRGVFIDDFIYSISHGGVRVHDVTNVSEVATARYYE